MKNLKKYAFVMMAVTALSSPSFADNGNMNFTFGASDKDQNGLISQAELQTVFLGNIPSDVFESYDVSNDGSLSQNEFSYFVEKNRDVMMNNRQELMQTKQKNKLAAEQAAAKNEAIQRKNAKEIEQANEFNSRPKVHLTMDFVVYDKDRNKQIDMAEFKARTRASDPAEIYATYDSNKDGSLNISEFKRYVSSDPLIPIKIGAK